MERSSMCRIRRVSGDYSIGSGVSVDESMAVKIKTHIAILLLCLGTGAANGRAVPAFAQVRGSLSIYADDRSRTGDAYGVLTTETLKGNAKRRNYFAGDQKIPRAWRATEADYARSGFDIGHLAAASWYGDQGMQDATFILTNAAPQNPSLNRGLWATIERRVKDEVVPGVSVHFVVGPLWLPDGKGVIEFGVIGEHAVWIPTHMATSILMERAGTAVKMKCWIVPNQAPPDGVTPGDYLRTVDEHEFDRGRDFFSWLSDSVENTMEAKK
jgi:endonuclease G